MILFVQNKLCLGRKERSSILNAWDLLVNDTFCSEQIMFGEEGTTQPFTSFIHILLAPTLGLSCSETNILLGHRRVQAWVLNEIGYR